MSSRDPKTFSDSLRRGNPLAYHRLFNEHYEALFSYAFKLSKSADLASDIVQQVFINLYERRRESEIEDIRAYLFRSVYHSAIAELKRNQPTEILMSEDAVENKDLIVEAEEEAAIWSAINELPEQCRKILLMNRFEGMKNQEIAEILGISKRTVETQISLGLKKLRSKLLIVIHLLNF